MADYGSGANWDGTDTSGKAVLVAWTTDFPVSDSKAKALDTAPPFTIPINGTALQAAEAMKAVWNTAYPHDPVTLKNTTVYWPSGTKITNMSFTVDDGSSKEVPPLGAAVGVVTGMTVQDVT